MISALTILLAGYLLGSVSSSLIVVRLYRGIDIRRYGSGNAGATNVVRVVGWRAGLTVAAFDVGKGFLAVWLLSRLRVDGAWGDGDVSAPLLAAVGAVAGHIWPVFAGFRGGKGVATAAGAMLAIQPLALLPSLGVGLLVLFVTRWVSLASISAVSLLPLAVWLQAALGDRVVERRVVLATAVIAALILFAHRSNIARLLAGAEPRFRRAGEAGPR